MWRRTLDGWGYSAGIGAGATLRRGSTAVITAPEAPRQQNWCPERGEAPFTP